jgi:competence protein CoiA
MWKRNFPSDWQEVVMGCHRADIKTPTMVVEFQASSISQEEIRERENFYGRMVWILKGGDFEDNLQLRQREGFVSFRWKWPRKSWWSARAPIFIDLNDCILHVKKLYDNVPCGGWGTIITINKLKDIVGCCGLT